MAQKILRAKTQKKSACFVVHSGLDVGSVITLEDETTVLGRGSGCNVTLRDDGISRYHAEVVRTGPYNVLLRDLDSTNGTFVDGEKITEIKLKHGDKVLLGRRTILKFLIQDEVDMGYHLSMYESCTRDGLTGAFNRRYLTEKMTADISFARRHKVPFSLLIFDLDHFKKINDTFGHQVGDDVLVGLTEIVSKSIRAEDVLGRYGGEEFAVIAQGTDAAGAKSLAERIRQQVARSPIPVENRPDSGISVTLSVGVATVAPGAQVDVETVVAEADKNLYTAKQTGRNRVVGSEITARAETT